CSPYPPFTCMPCPTHGNLAGLAVGTTGTAFGAVAWGTCGQPANGPAGVQIFDVDTGGTGTVGQDVSGGDNGGGGPPTVCSFGLSGANHYVVKFGTSLGGIGHASATLPQPVYMGPGVPPPNACDCSAIDGDAAGNTFLAIAWNASTIPNYE